ncbi:MAG: CYTH domain-containing protein [Patescibacteria group bacterium]|jgi:predicted adenylyl cyclase CyaB|nr:CYTH domain-containing protein [Candidatus Shapirobacteria bacterium]
MPDNSKKQIEIELRSLLDKRKYVALKKFLDTNAKSLGKDDKDVYFFLLPDRIVKAVKNISQKTAKIVIKLNRLGRGRSDFEEIEIPISPLDFDKAVKLFSSLRFDQIQNSYQTRQNYLYEGVEIALKHTDSWGYHMELEVIIDDLSKKNEAERKIYQVANKLGVKIMTEEEITEFAQKIDAQYKKGIYKKSK